MRAHKLMLVVTQSLNYRQLSRDTRSQAPLEGDIHEHSVETVNREHSDRMVTNPFSETLY
jgi:hypothetical protein